MPNIDNLKKREKTDDVAILISQTGGGCRASNYKFLLKKNILFLDILITKSHLISGLLVLINTIFFS